MGTILGKIAAHARERAAEDQARLPLEELTDLCAQGGAADGAAFVNALEKPGMRFICEVKKASPSKGIISKDFPYLEIAGAKIIGVNNRNLKDFSVDFSNAARLRDKIPPDVLYVAESGVSSAEDAAALKKIGADAVLMGEVLMRAEDKAALLREMREAAR